MVCDLHRSLVRRHILPLGAVLCQLKETVGMLSSQDNSYSNPEGAYCNSFNAMEILHLLLSSSARLN